MRLLLVGDPHVVADEIPECARLMGMVEEVALDNKAVVVLLGDQHHNHAMVNVYVLDFWRSTFKRMQASGLDVIALVGNHDRPGVTRKGLHAMAAYSDICTVVDEPYVRNGVLFLPYYAQVSEFEKACFDHPTAVAVCHQTFDGSQYENGFYTVDGVDASKLPQKHFVSGHIHSPQEFGKVWYVGAPRWRNLDDANTERHLWLVEVSDHIETREPFDTSLVCKKLVKLVDTETSPAELPDGCSVRVELRGSREYVARREKELVAQGARVRSRVEEASSPKVSESEGVSKAFLRYLSNYKGRNGTKPERLIQLWQSMTPNP